MDRLDPPRDALENLLRQLTQYVDGCRRVIAKREANDQIRLANAREAVFKLLREIRQQFLRPEYQFPFGWSREIVQALEGVQEPRVLERAASQTAKQSDVDDLAWLVARLKTALLASPADTGDRGPKGEWAVDPQIVKVLDVAGHRMTAGKIIEAIAKFDRNVCGETVKKRLAILVKTGKLTNDPKAKPRGYGLSSWGS